MEDDVVPHAGFEQRVRLIAQANEAAAAGGDGSPGTPASILRLGEWSELYLIPLAGARQILCAYCRHGVILNSDNQLRLISGRECTYVRARVGARLYRRARTPGDGMIRRRADAARSRNRVAFSVDAVVNLTRSYGTPGWCATVEHELEVGQPRSCRWGAPMDAVSKAALDAHASGCRCHPGCGIEAPCDRSLRPRVGFLGFGLPAGHPHFRG